MYYDMGGDAYTSGTYGYRTDMPDEHQGDDCRRCRGCPSCDTNEDAAPAETDAA